MKRIAIFLVFSLPIFLFSQTIINGGNVSGVWNKCNSPYLIEETTTIEDGDTLIIQAGVTVVFTQDVYIEIIGHILANGNEQDSVYFYLDTNYIYKEPYLGNLFFHSLDTNLLTFSYCSFDGVNFESSYCDAILNLNKSRISNSQMYFELCEGINFEYSLFQKTVISIYGAHINVNHTTFDESEIYANEFDQFQLVFNDFVFKNAPNGALQTEFAVTKLTNGSFINNGGAVVSISDLGSNGHLILNNVNIENNNSGVSAIGCVLNIDNCLIKNNNNGGVYASDCYVSIRNCEISYNNSENGGGVYIYHSYMDSSGSIENSIIKNNSASEFGGGIYFADLNGPCSPFLINNTQIINNESSNGGGIGMNFIDNTLAMKNCIISNNHVSNNGGGIYIEEYVGELQFSNLSITQNYAEIEGGGIYIEDHTINPPVVTYPNNIIWGNSPDQIGGYNFDIYNFEYSNIQNGWPGNGNIDADPLFTDPANGDYSLSWANFPTNDATKSPCIDTGDPLSDPDPDGTTTDMGAHFFNQSEPYEPTILSISDVPADQGLTVDINWKASVTDDPTYNEITHYTIWRKVSATKSSWAYMGAKTADYSTSYSYIAPTLADSSEAGIPWFTFKIIAETSDPVIYYECQPDSGYSVDNLPPLAPTGLTGSFNNNIVTLNWDVSPDSDFDHFNIYKRDLSSSDPFLYLNSTIFNTFSDTWFDYANNEYKVTTIDINGNESDPGATWQTTVEPGFFADIKVMLEGPFTGSMMSTTLNEQDVIPLSQPYNTSPWNYNGTESVTTIPSPDIVDWILLELRQAPYVDYATSSAVETRKAAFLKSNGDIVAMDGMTLPRFDIVPSDDYYLVIWHRNHLGVLSAQPITMEEDQMTYDFTTGPDKYYHGIQGTKDLSAGTWGMIAADLNGDGIVDETDKSTGWNVEAGKSGYLFSDANLDAHTNNNDKNQLLYSNTSLESQVPENYQFNCGDPLYDYRDGKYYTTVQIGNQCWMAENINIGEMICGIEDQLDNGIIEKYCYGNLSEYCDTMGGMYQWDEMMAYSSISGTQGICPIGWHIPTDDEWCELEDFVDTGNIDCEELGWKGTDAGYRLKSSNGWLNNGNGGDDFGFTALPAGYRSSADGNFYRLTKGSYLWSSDENDSGTAWRTGMEYNFSSVSKAFQLKSDGRSVRCVKD
ncbi:MAG: hypothetical protein KQI35_10015 [Bacteroidetes bacterium]|nr:hypothetical protein [Bacteroidota bacterium]